MRICARPHQARLWTCPRPDEDHYVGECPDPAVSTIPMPTLRVVMVRESLQKMALESATLEFKAGEPAVPEVGK